MTERAQALLRALADGRRRSGEELAARLGVTRAAVWKQVHALHRWGLTVHAERGRGYRLAAPIDWLDEAALGAALRERGTPARLSVHLETDSTNQRLLEAPPPPGSLAVCLAEFQRAGRGRRGRSWCAPLGSGLCLSVAWQFEAVPRDFAALALAVGVVLRRVLAALGTEVALKWPNDLVHDERKLGGILVEGVSEAHGPCLVVIGLGLNVALPRGVAGDAAGGLAGATDLQTLCGACPSRTALAAELIAALGRLLSAYSTVGFTPFRDEWQQADCLRGREITISSSAGVEVGTALGIDAEGALLVAPPQGRVRRVLAGDVSVRSRA